MLYYLKNRVFIKDRVLIIGGGTLIPLNKNIKNIHDISESRLVIGGTGSLSSREIDNVKDKIDVNFLNRSSKIYVRGEKTKEILESQGISAKVSGDPIFKNYNKIKFNKNGGKLVLLDIHNIDTSYVKYGNNRMMKKNYVNIIKSMKQKKEKVVTCYTSDEDKNFAKKISNEQEVKCVGKIGSENQLDNLLNSCKFAFGTRLHISAFSVMRGVPTLAFQYQDKHEDLFSCLDNRIPGIKTNVYLDSPFEKMNECIEKFMDEKNYIRENLVKTKKDVSNMLEEIDEI